jgi:hypothetical protein
MTDFCSGFCPLCIILKAHNTSEIGIVSISDERVESQHAQLGLLGANLNYWTTVLFYIEWFMKCISQPVSGSA